ncbi:MAG: sensor histidine kinase, partial [Candidatus Eisenbacteria bacterium]|nr:sensor histidine kinase [Candidatus Eisenbacteria bacterium]
MPIAPRGRLFQQILLSMSAALLVAFVVAAAITMGVGGSALKKNAEDDLHGVAHLVHLRVESFLDARFADLRLTAAVEAMDDIVTGDEHFRIQNSLMRLRRELPGIYEELLVTDMNGGTIAATQLVRLDAQLPIEPDKLEPAADGTRLSAGPVDFASVPRKVLVLARPIVSRIDGEQSGWLIALVKWEMISQMVSEIPIGGREQRNTAFAVIECLGKPEGGGLLWLDPVATTGFTLARDEMRDEPENNSTERFHTPGGPPDIGPAYEWVVTVRRDPAEAFAIVRVFGWSVLGAAILGLLFAAMVAVRLAGGLSQRIDRLGEGTRKLAGGDYSNRVADPANDELGDLAKAFDTMADTLQSAQRDTEKANTELAENNRRLLEASRLKDEFLANISHELRTPLNGTLGFLGLVTDDLCDTPEEERENVQQAFRCAHQLKMLIEDVLDVSRIEAGRMTLARDAVPVKQALDRVIAEMYPLAHAKGITFRCDALEDERLAVRADAQRLHQVLRHLVDNAIKFTPSGTITLACVAPEAAGYARFEVRDSGIGMTADQLDRAFERFVQGDGSATRKFGGTGLGLSLVRDLVQMMGGVVQLASDGEGKGSVASFTL